MNLQLLGPSPTLFHVGNTEIGLFLEVAVRDIFAL